MKEYVLYFQSAGPSALDPAPVVLGVGTREHCEKVKRTLLASPDFVAILGREPHGKLQITPSAGSTHPVPVRIKNYQSRIAGVSGVLPV